jgi:hypothetical protein
MPEKSVVLNSWKEIAAYMGRGVRTVQRWERDLRLPVHRPKGKDRSAVLAFPAELDHWLLNTPVRNGVNGAQPAPLPANGALAQRMRHLRERAHLLREDMHEKATWQRQQAEKLTTTLRDVMRRMNAGPVKRSA